MLVVSYHRGDTNPRSDSERRFLLDRPVDPTASTAHLSGETLTIELPYGENPFSRKVTIAICS